MTSPASSAFCYPHHLFCYPHHFFATDLTLVCNVRFYQQQLEVLAAHVGPCLAPDLPTLLTRTLHLRTLDFPADLLDMVNARKRRGGSMRSFVDKPSVDVQVDSIPDVPANSPFTTSAGWLPSPTSFKRKRTVSMLQPRYMQGLGTASVPSMMVHSMGSMPSDASRMSFWQQGRLGSSVSLPARAHSVPSLGMGNSVQ